jgi:hypothetical protein
VPDSKSYPDLGKPGGPGLFHIKGKKLPPKIEAIAKHLHYEKGKDKSTAIAIAVSQCKKICATGESNFGKVSPAVRAEYCKSAAEWEADKAQAHADDKK